MTSSTPIKVLLFGAARMAESIFPALNLERLEIVAILEDPPRNAEKSRVFTNLPVVDISRARTLSFDYVLIACRAGAETEARLMEKLGVSREVMVSLDFAQMTLFYPLPLPEIIESYLEGYPGLREAVDVDALLREPELQNLRGVMNKRAIRILRQKGYVPAKAVDILEKPPSPQLPVWGDFVRYGTLALLAREIADHAVKGSVAELGVYKGRLTRLIREFFPDRLLYLFDTFEGFVPEQWKFDQNVYGCVADKNFIGVSAEEILRIVGDNSLCVVKRGLFPASAGDVDDTFAFVSIDVDLYQPTLDGLRFFYPKLAPGGYILVHDYGNERWKGCGAAVREFCAGEGIAWTPVCDRWGSAVIAKPHKGE